MYVNFVKLQNRKLKIKDESKEYEVGLLEENDVFRIKAGRRLLLDSIVLSGIFETIKSTVDGNDETMTLGKG